MTPLQSPFCASIHYEGPLQPHGILPCLLNDPLSCRLRGTTPNTTTFMKLYLTHQLPVISLLLISCGSTAESLIPLCFVLKIFVYLSSTPCQTVRSLRMDHTTSCACIYSLWRLEQCRLLENKFNRIFPSKGWQLGSELSNQSCIKYLMLGLHGILHFTLYRMDSLLFGFINMVITTSYVSE